VVWRLFRAHPSDAMRISSPSAVPAWIETHRLLFCVYVPSPRHVAPAEEPPVHDAWMGSAIRQSQVAYTSGVVLRCQDTLGTLLAAAVAVRRSQYEPLRSIVLGGRRTMSRLPGCLPLPSQAVQLAAHDRAPHNLVHEACEGRSNSEKGRT
jgi:hypothetical protein